MGVLASLPVRWLQKAAQLSKGWHFAVACTPTKCDRSITCKSIGDLTNFLRSLPQSEFVSAICCDVVALSGNTVQYHFDDEPSKAAQIRQILQLTWRCSQFWEYHAHYILNTFPRLKSLRIEVARERYFDGGINQVSPRFKLCGSLMSLTVVAEGNRKRAIVNIPWSGDDFPSGSRSLRLEGVRFLMRFSPESDVDIFDDFLLNQSYRRALAALYLDVDSAWWKIWGRRFEDGIFRWIKSQPQLTRFVMRQLNGHLQGQIQQLMLARLRRRSVQKDRKDQKDHVR